jgi:glycosyltransferase involved in cell wall biosynthesis
MKILSIITPVKFGGGERLILDQAKFFKAKKIDYHIVNLNKSEEFKQFLDKENLKYFNLTNIKFKQTPTKKEYLILFFKLLPYLFKLRRFIKKENPDIILANGFPAVFLVTMSLSYNFKNYKTIYIHHFFKSRESSLIRKIYLYFLKKYQKIVAVSSLTKKSLIEVFPEIRDKIISIPNGIDLKPFDIKESKEKLRKKLNLPEGILVINIGRLIPFKNQKFLIEVAKEIDKPNFYILIIGDGEEYENLKNLIEKENLQNRVKLLGFISSDKIPYYLKASDIFLFPSLKEGFGIVVLEAMASGLPVVIFKDIYIEEFGKDILVAKDEKEFIEMTKKLIENEDLIRELGEKVKLWSKNFDIANVCENYLKLFKELV